MQTIDNKEDTQTPLVRVNTLASAKRLLSRLITEYQKDCISTEKAKTLTYLLQCFVSIHKEIDLENKIIEMEKKLGAYDE